MSGAHEASDDTAALDRRARIGSSAALVTVLVAPAVLIWAWSRPAPAPLFEMPPLVLAPDLVREQLAADEAAARRAPEGPRAEERRRLYREINVAEHAAADPPGRARSRRRRLEAALGALVEEHGAQVLEALRASDLSRLDPALRARLPEPERRAELGGFVRMMRRYGLVEDGRQAAPRFVVRTVFKARWNALHGRPLTEGLSAIERRAYWGWLAIHGDEAAAARRLEALEHYAEAGGERAAQVRAVLLFDEDHRDDARAAFDEAWRRTPTFRLRNHALACAAEGSSAEDPP